MVDDDLYITYSSPPHKRKFARIIAVVSILILGLCLWSAADSYVKRKAKGYDPLPPSTLVTFVAPMMMIGIGLWIGWGQTRIDLHRRVVVRRPLGIPWPAKTVRFSDAQRLHVSFYRAPTTMVLPSAGVIYKTGDRGRPFWFVRLEGEKAQTMLILQRTYDEAVEFAKQIGNRVNLPVEIDEQPSD